MVKDLTVGKPSSVLIRFSLPLFGSIIFQQLYNLADSFIAGKFLGEAALASVGNSYEVTLIYLAFAFGCNIGVSVIVSRLFGAKNFKDMKSAVTTTFAAVGVLCAVLMVLGMTLSAPLLRLINTPEDLMHDTLAYLEIYTGGLFFLFFYNIATGIFSALGDSKTPFIFLACSSVANIFVNILFAVNFGMGVAGLAWATFMCQGISCVGAVVLLFVKLHHICPRDDSGKAAFFSPKLLKIIMRIAVPSILQQSSISIGNIIIQSIINSYGTGVMAGYTAAVKLNAFAINCFTTTGTAMSNFTSQNLGAGKPDRIRHGFFSGAAMSAIIALIFTSIFCIFPDSMVNLFITDPSEDAMKAGMNFLYIVSPFYIPISVKLLSDGVLRGGGAMNHFLVSTCLDLILRVLLAFILSAAFESATGIWWAWPIGWVISAVLSFIFYKRGVWSKKEIAL